MASNINLMDLPQEILVMTLREFFSTAEVNLIHPAYPITRGKPQPKPRSQNFLTPMLISKALQSIADEVYLEHSTFRFKGSAEARYHRVTPTEHSRQLRHISGLPDKVSLANFKMPQFRKNLPKIRSLSLRGKMPAYGTGKTDLQPHDVVVLKVLESEAISDFKALQDKFKSQGIHVTAFLDFVCPTSNHKLREKWQSIKVVVTTNGSLQLIETTKAERNFYIHVEQNLAHSFGNDAFEPEWPRWQVGNLGNATLAWQK